MRLTRPWSSTASRVGSSTHPADLRADVRALVVPLPRAHHVAVPEQLDAAAAEHVDRAAEQAVDDQEAAVVGVVLERRGRVPLAGADALQPRARVAPGALQLARVQQLAEVRVGLDDRDRLHRPTVSPPDASYVRMPT